MLRTAFLSFCCLVGSAGLAFGQATPSITVDSRPSPADTANRVVLALPIASPGAGSYAGAGQSIQQDLVADLTSLTAAHVIAPGSAHAVTDEQAALEQGRQNGAGFVVWGQAQVSGNQMRVTGQLLDVSSGRPLAGLKATAPADNLFPLEDSLAAQVARALPASIGLLVPPPQTQPTGQGTEAAREPAPLPPALSEQSPATEPSNPYYSYTATVPKTYYTYNTYYYPSYWSPYWDYPYVWGGIGFYGGWGLYHGGWYHHGWGDHDWRGGHYGYRGYSGGFRGGYGGGFHGGGFHGGGSAGHGGGGGGHR